MKRATLIKVFGAIILLLLLLLFFRGCNPTEPLQRAMSLGDTQAVEKILKSNPSLADKPLRFGRMTPLFYATMCRNPKETIDLLVISGADINAKSGGFN